jgi:hypothetical protein
MFKFNIRDLLWLTAIVAVSLGWWLERRSLLSLNEQTVGERDIAKFQLESITELMSDAGFKVEKAENSVRIDGPFQDGKVSRGLHRFP